MRGWAVAEFAERADPAEHLREVAAAAGWQSDGPIHVPASTPFRQLQLVQQAFPGREIRSADDVLLPLRSRKDAQEIEVMREAARKTAAGVRSACARLRPGVTRLELFRAVRDEILGHGVDDVVLGPDCWAIGPTVAVDWTTAATRNADPRLEAPCSVSLDVGASLRGYRSDVGRTIFVGEPPPRSAEALAVLREARAAGEPVLRAGRLRMRSTTRRAPSSPSGGSALGSGFPRGTASASSSTSSRRSARPTRGCSPTETSSRSSSPSGRTAWPARSRRTRSSSESTGPSG